MEKKLYLIGGGGHCKSCIDVIELEKKYKINGIIDLKEKISEKILNYEIIASDDMLETLVKENNYFFITLGQIKNPNLRIKIYNKLKKLNVNIPIIVSPKARISNYSKIEEGTIIMHNSIINSDSKVGKNCIINTGAIIEHDAKIGDFCHISTSTVINGNCEVGHNSFIGSRVVLFNGVKISSDVLVAAGSVVMKDIKEPGTYMGNPARRFL